MHHIFAHTRLGVTEYVPAKIGELPSDIPQFAKDFVSCGKYLRDNKHNSLHWTLKLCSDICPWT